MLLSTFHSPGEYEIPALPNHLLRVIAEADTVATKLLSLPHPHRLLLLSNKRHYRTPAVIHRLIQGVDRLVQSDPRQAFLLAGLAKETADALDPKLWGAAIVTDARAESRIARGNAYRLLGDPLAAQQDFCDAESLLDDGTGDRLLLAEFHSKAASLRLQTHGAPQAMIHLRKARRTLAAIGETANLLRVEVQLAEVLARSRDLPSAIALLQEVCAKSASIPGCEILNLGATINLAGFLTDANEPLRALSILQPVADRGSTLPRSLFFSLIWKRARLDRALTLFDAATRQFGRLYACYESEGMHRDALLVAIDLADTLLQAERRPEALQLLRSISDQLQKWEYLREGVQRWAATATTVEQRAYSAAAIALAGLQQWQAAAPPPFPPYP